MTPEQWIVIGIAITGGCSFMGVVYQSNKNHNTQDLKQDAMLETIRAENKAAMDLIRQEFKANCDVTRSDIKRLELKQDKHNSLIERMTIVEQKQRSDECIINAMQQKM